MSISRVGWGFLFFGLILVLAIFFSKSAFAFSNGSVVNICGGNGCGKCDKGGTNNLGRCKVANYAAGQSTVAFACGADNGNDPTHCVGAYQISDGSGVGAIGTTWHDMWNSSTGYHDIGIYVVPFRSSGTLQNNWVCKVQIDFYNPGHSYPGTPDDFVVWRDPDRCSTCTGVYGNCTGWSACSVSCGGGTQTRTCYDTGCGTAQTQSQSCNTQSCCTASAPQTITNPSPVSGATNQATSVSLTFPYNSSTFNWGTGCPSNSDSFTFYFDTNPNPTTVKCTNTGSAASISNSCAASSLAFNTTYNWKVLASNGSQSTTSPPAGAWSFTTQNSPAWWQVKDGDVITNGSIQSTIPSGLFFGLSGAGGFHGIPTYGTSATFGSGTVSASPAWIAQVTTNYKKTFNYAFFKSQIPTDVQNNISEINSTSISGLSGATTTRGYEWYHFNGAQGDLTISSNLNLGSRKVILLVEGADLAINGKINLTKGTGFFMVVVGQNGSGAKGNISIASTVAGTPSLEGIFYADSQVKTGAGSSQLYMRGSVAGYGGIVFERNLGGSNSTTPGEVFEYAHDIIALYPNVLSDRHIRWKEVAP